MTAAVRTYKDSDVPAGVHTWRVRARDDAGLATDSAPQALEITKPSRQGDASSRCSMAGERASGAARYSLAGPARLLLDLRIVGTLQKAKLRLYVKSGQRAHHGLARHAGLVRAARCGWLRAGAPRLRDDPPQPHAARRAHAPRADRERPRRDRRHGRAQAVDEGRVSARGGVLAARRGAGGARSRRGTRAARTSSARPISSRCSARREHSEAAHDLAEALSDLAPDAAIIGACAADGVIGAGREQQGGAGARAARRDAAGRCARHAVPRAGRRGARGARARRPAGAARRARSWSRSRILTRRRSSSWSTGLGGVPVLGRLRGARRPRRGAPVHERRLRRGGRRRHRARRPAAVAPSSRRARARSAPSSWSRRPRATSSSSSPGVPRSSACSRWSRSCR